MDDDGILYFHPRTSFYNVYMLLDMTHLMMDESLTPLNVSISYLSVLVKVEVTIESLIDVENSNTPVLKSTQLLSTE